MSQLLVTADDLGMNTARSHGIFLCAEQGIVRGTGLIVNGSDAERAARRAREQALPTGLHLTLTMGEPISKPETVATLVTSNGVFLNHAQLLRALAEGAVDPIHIEREIRAQVEWFFDHRGDPTHLSSHHHIHLHARIVPLLIPTLLRCGIRFVRIPAEPLPPFGWEIEKNELAEAKAIADAAAAARPLFEAHGISSTDHFRGLALLGNASKKNLRHILSRFPDGVTELMVHPGSPTPHGTDFDRDPQRQTELQMLTDPELPAMLQERKIALCSYGDLL